jgi:hypothetical protein
MRPSHNRIVIYSIVQLAQTRSTKLTISPDCYLFRLAPRKEFFFRSIVSAEVVAG